MNYPCASDRKILLAALAATLLLISGCTRSSKSRSSPTLAQMAQATQLLVAAFDGKENPCDLSTQEAMGILPQMRAKIDERYKIESAEYLNKTMAQKLATWPLDCKADCSCSFFTGFAEYLEQNGHKLSDLESNRYVSINAESKKPALDRSHCVSQAAQWFCKSDILKQMKSDLKN